MTWENLDGTSTDPTSLIILVRVALPLVATGDTTALFWASGYLPAADYADDGIRQYDGRIVGRWSVSKLSPEVGQSQWNHPKAEFNVRVRGATDPLWDYLGDDYEWDGATCQVWLIDRKQGVGVASKRQIKGTIWRGPEDLELNTTFQIQVNGNHFGVKVPATPLGNATETGAGFIQPPRLNATLTPLIGNITASATSMVFSGLPVEARSGLVGVLGTGANREAIYIGQTAVGNVLESCVRGYAGTVATSHASGVALKLYRPSPHSRLIDTSRAKTYVPYVFGQRGNNRGIVVEATPMATTSTFVGGGQETWFTRGIASASKIFWDTDRASGVSYASAGHLPFSSYNDLNAVYPNVGRGSHLQPGIIKVGSYVARRAILPWSQNNDKVWVHCQGINSGGTAIRWPAGILAYLLEQPDWALGLTSTYDGTRISGLSAGGWGDEYAGEPYWSNVTGITPAPTDTELPNVMDTLQELADVTNGDIFTRGGVLYPKRRRASAAADVTITLTDMAEGHRPQQLRDVQDLYCNRLTAEHEQTIWSEPDFTNMLPPIPVPWSVVLDNEAEKRLRGTIEVTRTTRWWRFHMPDPWEQNATTQQEDFIRYWKKANIEHFEHRSQRQVWMRSVLPARFAALEQGMIALYDITPYTTTKGQIREVVIEGGGGSPVTVEVLSWHIDF